jgi:NAD-dependent dihydropyrimidine dehydrogenase PreA subunit
MSDKIAIIISKDRTPNAEQEKLQGAMLAELTAWHHVTTAVVPHLYDLAPDGPALELLRRQSGDLIVLGWLYPRASYWVLEANGVKGRLERTSSLPEEDYDEPKVSEDQPERTIWCFDLRTHAEAEPYLEEIGRIVGAAVPPARVEELSGTNGHVKVVDEPTRQRWYPVIDYGRCENCLECLNFCLFGVFGLDAENRVVAEQPDACRPGCPACSRVCSMGAIMFPQHHDPGIAGDPKASKSLKLDLSQLFRGTSPAEIAAAERQRALDEQWRQEDAKKQAPKPADQDNLDRLVDEVDDMNL